MARIHKGNFKGKHPAGQIVDPIIKKGIEGRLDKDGIKCSEAHNIANCTDTSPQTIGVAIDLLEYRIHGCQLGLFGQSSQYKTVKPAKIIQNKLRDRIEKSVRNQRITCFMAWKIADQSGIQRSDVADACEAMGIKIESCQLGAF